MSAVAGEEAERAQHAPRSLACRAVRRGVALAARLLSSFVLPSSAFAWGRGPCSLPLPQTQFLLTADVHAPRRGPHPHRLTRFLSSAVRPPVLTHDARNCGDAVGGTARPPALMRCARRSRPASVTPSRPACLSLVSRGRLWRERPLSLAPRECGRGRRCTPTRLCVWPAGFAPSFPSLLLRVLGQPPGEPHATEPCVAVACLVCPHRSAHCCTDRQLRVCRVRAALSRFWSPQASFWGRVRGSGMRGMCAWCAAGCCCHTQHLAGVCPGLLCHRCATHRLHLDEMGQTWRVAGLPCRTTHVLAGGRAHMTNNCATPGFRCWRRQLGCGAPPAGVSSIACRVNLFTRKSG